MTSISWLIGENPIKGIVITMLGILVASIGMDTLSGAPRFEFGNMYLLGGVPFTPFIIGCVGFAQVIKLINEREADDAKRHNEDSKTKLSIRSSMPTGHDIKRILPPILRFRRNGHLRGRSARLRCDHRFHGGLRHAEEVQE